MPSQNTNRKTKGARSALPLPQYWVRFGSRGYVRFNPESAHKSGHAEPESFGWARGHCVTESPWLGVTCERLIVAECNQGASARACNRLTVLPGTGSSLVFEDRQ